MVLKVITKVIFAPKDLLLLSYSVYYEQYCSLWHNNLILLQKLLRGMWQCSVADAPDDLSVPHLWSSCACPVLRQVGTYSVLQSRDLLESRREEYHDTAPSSPLHWKKILQHTSILQYLILPRHIRCNSLNIQIVSQMCWGVAAPAGGGRGARLL